MQFVRSRVFSSCSQLSRGFANIACNKFKHVQDPKTATIVGAPIGLGQPLLGVDQGPRVIREAGLVQRLHSLGWKVEDAGDLDFSGYNSEIHQGNTPQIRLRNSLAVGNANKELHDVVYREALQNKFVISLGGDHSMGIGSLSGILRARPDVSVVWVDAHADINTPETSFSGNLHGMSVAFVMGMVDCNKAPGFSWLAGNPLLTPDRLVYVALRDLDGPEKEILRRHNIKAFTMHHVDKFGIGKVMEMALDHVNPYDNRPLHLSLDIDSVDPIWAPATGTTVRGGLTYREVFYVCESVADTGALSSMDMAEVNPLLSGETAINADTADLAARLIATAAGDTLL